MRKYIDADELYAETKKRIVESHEARMAVVDDEFLEIINDAYYDDDVVEIVRCKDCDVPHNKWTGCPNLNGMVPHPEFFCANGKRKQTNADENDKNVGQKPACKVCERITEASKDIFWCFARTHQPEDKDEFCRVQARFCPACGREIEKLREVTQEEYSRCVKGEW